ncbi:MAG: ABC transporter ATP-binding protein, partial [Rubrivivax sp.]|nr:ABC transporter ATP-binding protein [Rubrivivax sp.]
MAAADSAPLLAVDDLSIRFRAGGGELEVTRGVTFTVQRGERVGIVGESGCGKTVTGLALMGQLPGHLARVSGSVRFEGRELLAMSRAERRTVCGPGMGMIFQEPMSALDPVFTVGEQIVETLLAHRAMGRAEARERAVEALARVGIPLPQRRFHEYPHSLSGGMRQRVMIAIALACEPRLLIADEPTTALDVTIQAQIVELLLSISERTGTALLFITHDLGVVAEIATRVITMYAGEVVEDAPIEQVYARPRHPYTAGLMASLPDLARRGQLLASIPGRVPQPGDMPAGCRFRPRCPHAAAGCDAPQPLRR